jgi:hypothetical protein
VRIFMDDQQKATIARAAELARENSKKLQQPMPHTLRKRAKLEKRARK